MASQTRDLIARLEKVENEVVELREQLAAIKSPAKTQPAGTKAKTSMTFTDEK